MPSAVPRSRITTLVRRASCALYIKRQVLESAEPDQDPAGGVVDQAVVCLALDVLDLGSGERLRREPRPHAAIDLRRPGLRAHDRAQWARGGGDDCCPVVDLLERCLVAEAAHR